MALTINRSTDAILFALVAGHNLAIRADTAAESTFPHADVTSTTSGDYRAPVATALHVAAAVASSLATGITLAENIRSVLLVHLADGGNASNSYGGAHKAVDTVNAALIAYATIAKLTATSTQGQLNTLLNACKAVVNAHMSQIGVHFAADGVTTIAASDASDLATSQTLANEMRTDINTHIDFAGASQTITLTPSA